MMRLPNDVAVLLQAGIQYQQSGRFQEAETCYRQVLAAHPGHGEASFLLGDLINRSGRDDLAVPLLRTAVEADPDDMRYLFALRSVLLKQGRLEEALTLFKEATARLPERAELLATLGSLFALKYQENEALASYQRALERDPNLLMAHANLGLLYFQLGRTEESLAASARAIALHPTHAGSHANMGFALIKQGKLAEGITALRRALALQPLMAPAHQALVSAYLQADDPAAALRAAREARVRLGFSSGVLAFEYVALNELGYDDEASQLMDFDHLIYFESLAIPSEYGSVDDFNSTLAAEMRTHPSLLWEPALKTTRGGYLSADLVEQPTPTYRVFEQLLREKLENFIAALPAGPLHPVFSRKSSNFRLHVWATVLDTNGHQDSHVHSGAWLSGVYYVELPRTLGPTAEQNAGWIEFGRPPNEYNLRRAPLVRAVQPRTGFMVLFPSYFFHRTVPFPGGGQRISIAFDVVV
jgi:uncharacterized protein (TIGR02466 family)